MKRTTLIARTLLTLFIPLASGCDSLNINFSDRIEISDRTVYPSKGLDEIWGASSPDKNIAEGAILPLTIFGARDEEIPEYSVDDPSILEIIETVEGVTTFRALTSGITTIRVQSEEASDFVEITVQPVASSRIKLYPWHPLVALPETLWEDGIGIFPSTNVTIAGIHLDPEGNGMGGYGSKPLTLSSSAEETGVIMDKEYSDMAVYRSPAIDGVLEELQVGGGEGLTLQTVTATDVAELELFFYESHGGKVLGDGESGEVQEDVMVHLVLRSQTGAYIVGDGDFPFELEREVDGTLSPLNTQGKSGEESGIDDFLSAGRAASIHGMVPGVDNIIHARWGSLEMSVTLQLTTGP